MHKKCVEVIEKHPGDIGKVVKIKEDPNAMAIMDLCKVKGVGAKKAAELYSKGFSLEHLM